jgi:hypothetical protein
MVRSIERNETVGRTGAAGAIEAREAVEMFEAFEVVEEAEIGRGRCGATDAMLMGEVLKCALAEGGP